jgi:predicted Zn-ribbon and HTH transcriptional regulator
MFRKNLIELLRDNPMTVSQLARALDEDRKAVVSDLEHLQKSLRHSEYELEITPAECRKCGFVFGTHKLRKPSRCPECKGERLTDPVLEIRARK